MPILTYRFKILNWKITQHNSKPSSSKNHETIKICRIKKTLKLFWSPTNLNIFSWKWFSFSNYVSTRENYFSFILKLWNVQVSTVKNRTIHLTNFHEIDRPIYRFGDGTNETGAKQTSTSRLIAVPKKRKLTENSLTELIFIRYRPPRATLESRVR